MSYDPALDYCADCGKTWPRPMMEFNIIGDYRCHRCMADLMAEAKAELTDYLAGKGIT